MFDILWFPCSISSKVYKSERSELIRTNSKMKTCVAVLIFSLFYLCGAQLQQTGGCSTTKIRTLSIVFLCAGDTALDQANCKPVLDVTEAGAKLGNVQEQLQSENKLKLLFVIPSLNISLRLFNVLSDESVFQENINKD